MPRLETVFMGTPDFAVPALKALAKNGYNISLVVTQPDRRIGEDKIKSEIRV